MNQYKEGDIYYWANENSPNLKHQDSGISIYRGFLEYRNEFGNYDENDKTDLYIIVQDIVLFSGDNKPRSITNNDKDHQYRMEFHGWNRIHEFSKNIEDAYRRAIELALDSWKPYKD